MSCFHVYDGYFVLWYTFLLCGGNKSDLYTPRVYRGLGEGGGVYIPFGKGYVGFLDFRVFLKIIIKP